MAVFSILIIFGAVFFYNQMVGSRHDISRLGVDLRRAEVENAELKNNFYKLADAKNLEILAQGNALVLDKNPSYFRVQQLTARESEGSQ